MAAAFPLIWGEFEQFWFLPCEMGGGVLLLPVVVLLLHTRLRIYIACSLHDAELQGNN